MFYTFATILILGIWIASIIGFIALRISMHRHQWRHDEDETPYLPPDQRATIHAYSPEGEYLFQSTQHSPYGAFFSEQQTKYLQAHPGCTSIRSHPHDAPPTISDLVRARYTRLAELIVCSPNYVYSVRPGRFGWRDNNLLEQAIRRYLSDFELTFSGDTEIEIAEDGAVTFDSDILVELSDKAMENIARDLSYDYKKRPICDFRHDGCEASTSPGNSNSTNTPSS